jgi:hypothetical protein
MKEWLTWNMYNVFEWSDMSICKLLVLYKVDTIPSKYNLFSPWYSQVRVITVFTVFRLLTDFVCLYNYEFWLSLCKCYINKLLCVFDFFLKHGNNWLCSKETTSLLCHICHFTPQLFCQHKENLCFLSCHHSNKWIFSMLPSE